MNNKLLLSIIAGAGLLLVSKKVNKMQVSPVGIALIKVSEGFHHKPYLDPVGKWTIGYGHLIKPGEKFTSISREEGEALLRKDIAHAAAGVNSVIKVPLTQHEYDVLVDFAFNLGVGSLKSSTLARELNALPLNFNYDHAKWLILERELPRWNKGRVNGDLEELPGLTTRRMREVSIAKGIIPGEVQRMIVA